MISLLRSSILPVMMEVFEGGNTLVTMDLIEESKMFDHFSMVENCCIST